MRADAEKHRSELIEAAARVFSSQGPDVPLQAVLEEAGLSRGTLYRYFPDRQALMVAVLRLELTRFVAFVDENEGSPDLLREFLRRQCSSTSAHSPLVAGLRPNLKAEFLEWMQGEVSRLYDRVIAQAKCMKLLGSDFTQDDLILLIRMLVGAISGHRGNESAWIERGLDIVLAGVRPSALTSTPDDAGARCP